MGPHTPPHQQGSFSLQTVRAFATLFSALALGLTATAQTSDTSSTPGTWTGTSHATSSLVQLYGNGPWITGTGNGAAGADTSEIQAGFNTFGYGMQQSVPNRVADDFPVPAAQTWTLTEVEWFSYQTGSSTTSTFNNGWLQFWSGGAPNAGGTVLAGDLTTNRFIGATWTNVYKVTATTLLNTQRPVMRVRLDASFAPGLGTGTYWVDCALGGSLTSGPWGTPTVPAGGADNALQNQAGTWVAVIDGVALLPQDFPFTIQGNTGGGCPTPTIYCTAKTTSSGCVPSIGFSGLPGPLFVVRCFQVEPGQLGVLFYSTSGPAAIAFQGGTLCVVPPVNRMPVQHSGGFATCSGTYFQPMGGVIGMLAPGTTVHCQHWFRDPGDAFGTGLSDALGFVVP